VRHLPALILALMLGAYPAIGQERSSAMTQIRSTPADRTVFEELLADYASAWTSRDGELKRRAIERLYAPDADLVFYDAILPRRFKGRTEMLAHGEELFAGLRSMTLTPAGDLDVRRMGQDFAWTTTVINMDARTKTGEVIAFPMRQTAVWERRKGRWVMVHEHVSAPIGSGAPRPE